MTPKERVAVALRGGKPDRIPIVPIYDMGYICNRLGIDQRRWNLCGADEKIRIIEESFHLHDGLDGFFVHAGNNDEAADFLHVEECAGHWRVTDTRTGEAWGLLDDCSRCSADGHPLPRQGDALTWESRIQTEADIDRLVGPVPTPGDIEAGGRFWPLRRLAAKYPDCHFSFQSGTPMVFALNACGGFVEALTMLATEPALYAKVLARVTGQQCALMAAGKAAGADSTWFTCYYTGADTIAPETYAQLIFPFEREICREAKRQGLFVLDWYLGDLMPNLDTVLELPIDALVLEQGRKGYDIDPVEIRRRAGPDFCLFGFGFENDYCTDDRDGLSRELARQIAGAGRDGAFVAGTPIMPPNARPEAVDFYFAEARRLGAYR